MRYIISITIIILWQCTTTLGQQVWPGDINNNGIVNNIDVLYWAVANGATGGTRAGASSNWEGQALPATLWEDNFPNGLNYAYADCDGDGDVDDDDKTIIEQNFSEQRADITPDVFTTGDPAQDPILALFANETSIAPGGTLEAQLSLGTDAEPISDFYGIAFTIRYDPDFVDNGGNSVRLDILEDTWMNGMGDDKVIRFINNDRQNGIVQIAIVRKNQITVDGFGDIGTVSIVMEDIFTGYNSNVNTTNIMMIDRSLAPMPVAPSELAFDIDTSLTSNRQLIRREGVSVYPNPVSADEVSIELKDEQERIRRIQVFDLSGRRLTDRSIVNDGNNRTQLNISTYPVGLYTVKILSDQHVYVQSFVRKR